MVREKSQRVRQIIISLGITIRLSMKQLNNAHYGYTRFIFFYLGVCEQKKSWEPLNYNHFRFADLHYFDGNNQDELILCLNCLLLLWSLLACQ